MIDPAQFPCSTQFINADCASGGSSETSSPPLSCCLPRSIARVALGLLFDLQGGLAFRLLGSQRNFKLCLFCRLACCPFDSSTLGFRRDLCRQDGLLCKLALTFLSCDLPLCIAFGARSRN